MNEGIASFISSVLSIASLALLVFTVGAVAGWRWASPKVLQAPTWIFVTGHVAWWMLLLSQLLRPRAEGFEWLSWLTMIVMVGSALDLALRLRARAAERSGGG